jgi:hypothetical protein
LGAAASSQKFRDADREFDGAEKRPLSTSRPRAAISRLSQANFIAI